MIQEMKKLKTQVVEDLLHLKVHAETNYQVEVVTLDNYFKINFNSDTSILLKLI